MSDPIYKHLRLTGTSTQGIEDAVNAALAKANESVRNVGWFTLVETRGQVMDGWVTQWQVTIDAGFRLD